MAKRIADKELTDRNWDQEEEGEDAGTFSIASKDVLQSRPIKKAKRRNTGGESEGGGAFKGFKGFSMTNTPSTTPTAFSRFDNTRGFKGFGGLSNGTCTTPKFGGFPSPPGPTGVTFNGPSSTKPASDVAAQQTNGSPPGSTQSPCSRSKEYSRQLTALNCSVRDWITKHVNDNPLCDLNPIFRDYERHLASIERQYGADGCSEEKKQGAASAPPPSSSSSSSSSSSAAPSAAFFSFSKTTAEDESQKSCSSTPLPAGVTFKFGEKVDSSVLGSLTSKPSIPSFSSSSSNQSSLFGAPGPAAPLSFGGTRTEDAPAADNGDEESEEPPKQEVKEVKEDDAFYSKKCKLFYKKDMEFKEKGVGTLHLKLTAEGKMQMVIRADTNLGNILLNILVPQSMLCSRVGKNNVMVICVPNPPVDDKNQSAAVPLLIRVKTSEDADELHKTLEEKKG